VMHCEFVIPGPPVPKARARYSGSGRGGFYTPEKTKEAESDIDILFHEAVGLGLVEDKKSHFGVGCIFYTKDRRKLDVDNLLKLVLDGINGLWGDDSQVWGLYATRYVDKDNPRTEVRIWTLEE